MYGETLPLEDNELKFVIFKSSIWNKLRHRSEQLQHDKSRK